MWTFGSVPAGWGQGAWIEEYRRMLVEHSEQGAHGFEGRYREVSPPERLVHTFEWDGMPAYVIIETIELVALPDGRTKLVNTSLFHTTEERDGMLASGMEQGLSGSYVALDRVLASLD